MTVLTDTQVITASGGLVELGYVERTTSVAVSGIFSSQTDLGLSVTVVCDGSPILIEFFCEEVSANATANDFIIAALWQDGSEFNRCTAVHYSPSTGTSNNSSMYGQLRVTPSVGSHTYSMKGFVGNSARPGTFFASAAGIQSYSPMRLRVSKIVQATQWPAVTTGTIICTSSTRPASPFVGQQIYETDTRRSWTYIAAAWVPDDGIFATEAARDAAIPSPFKGQRAFLTAPTTPTRTASALTIYDGTVWVNVTPQGAAVITGETTTSLTYADLATSGPAITMVTGTTALITVVAEISNTGANQTKMSFSVSAAGSPPVVTAASDDFSAKNNLTTELTLQRTTLITGLTAGTNTFTAKYRVSAGTGTFFRRAISGVGIA